MNPAFNEINLINSSCKQTDLDLNNRGHEVMLNMKVWRPDCKIKLLLNLTKYQVDCSMYMTHFLSATSTERVYETQIS